MRQEIWTVRRLCGVAIVIAGAVAGLADLVGDMNLTAHIDTLGTASALLLSGRFSHTALAASPTRALCHSRTT
ncbi:hypothetical protein HNP60_000673 [Sphingobium sp. B1D3A]|uniref:Uncharacterized protein n=1 Tax=Sphingobium lignivorans TaxID=2735886 RepID=A0ABR6NEP1_9SPHN|nr:hypothetical protein [Sphingobium lignivorans]